MARFCVLEGVDGAGKSHVARMLRKHVAGSSNDLAVVLKDDALQNFSPWPQDRLRRLHGLTWSYDDKEPVWEYPRVYWLYQLLAWFEFFYQYEIGPRLAEGLTVVTDGWYFKHQARFRLASEEESQLADSLFGRLRLPDQVIVLDLPMEEISHRKHGTTKPSEHGAFDHGNSSLDEASFKNYQGASRSALHSLLREHGIPIHVLTHQPSPAELIDLIRQGDLNGRES